MHTSKLAVLEAAFRQDLQDLNGKHHTPSEEKELARLSQLAEFLQILERRWEKLLDSQLPHKVDRLRELTGVRPQAAREALTLNEGDVDHAETYLLKQGQA